MNRGRFSVSREFFNNIKPGDGVNLFNGMVVLQAQYDLPTHKTNYLAVHEDFEEVPESCIAPEYMAEFNSDSIYPKWVKCD